MIWRYRSGEAFLGGGPGGAALLQQLIVERLDDALPWLESLGAPVTQRETGNPRTVGTRFDPQGLTDALARAAGGVRVGQPLQQTVTRLERPLVLATGGFGGSRELVARYVTPEVLA